jgi:hypothetical protein
MAEARPGRADVNARIVYWGVEGGGKTTNLRSVYAKLRPDHRGELREIPTRLDPSIAYEVLPIELGDVAGVRTQIQISSVPGMQGQAPTRKQLLDRVDGIVLVIDSQRERIDENVASFDELRGALAAYGRSLDDIPLVVQYNKRDLADSYALEELHRKLDLRGIAVFEAVATEGIGVLQTLSTISKRVIRTLRDREGAAAPAPSGAAVRPADAPRPASARAAAPAPRPAAAVKPASAPRARPALERALLREPVHPDAEAIEATARRAEALLDDSWDAVSRDLAPPPTLPIGSLSIVSVGRAERAGERSVRIPLVLGDTEGRTTSVVLTVQVDPAEPETGI